MKTKIFSILVAACLGMAACSSSREGQSGTDTMSGDTSGMGTTDTTTSGTTTTDTTGTSTGTDTTITAPGP